MGAVRNALRAGHGRKLVDGALYRLCEVACREHWMDRLSGKTLQSGLYGAVCGLV